MCHDDRSGISLDGETKDFRQFRLCPVDEVIPQTAGVSAEMKAEVEKIYKEIEHANREILSY